MYIEKLISNSKVLTRMIVRKAKMKMMIKC